MSIMDKKFRKRPGTTDKGKEFEELMVAFQTLSLSLDPEVEDFWISCNDENFGNFDDLVVSKKMKNGEEDNFALQMKHQERTNLQIEALEAPSGNFSLRKYCLDTVKIFDEKFTYILHTNKKFCLKAKVEELKLNSKENKRAFIVEIFQKSDNTYGFSIDRGKNPDATKEEISFFKNLILKTNQDDVSQLKDKIVKILEESFLGKKDDFFKYQDFVTKWNEKQGRKVKLNKEKIVEQLVSIFCPKVKPTEQCCQFLNDILRQAILNFDITVLQEPNDFADKIWTPKTSPRIIEVAENSRESTIKRVKFFLENNQGKQKIILLNSGDVSFDGFKTFQNLHDLKLLDLDIYKKILTEFPCKFQGRDCKLGDFMEESDDEIAKIITTDDLFKMANEIFEVGGKKEQIPECHVERVLPKTIVKTDFLAKATADDLIVIVCEEKFDDLKPVIVDKDFVVINGLSVNTEDPKGKKILHITSSPDDFEKIRIRNVKKNYFHFRYSQGYLEWIDSSNIDRLKQFQEQSSGLFDKQSNVLQTSNRMNIICADPGMGKSTMMKNFKTQCDKRLWAVYFNAREQTERALKYKNADLFIANLLEDQSSFEAKIFQEFYRMRRIVIFWDGLDELQDETKKNDIIKLIKGIGELNIRQWLASRCNLKPFLEETFKVFAKNIQEFDIEQQKSYITNRLCQKYTEEEVRKISDQITKNIGYLGAHSILGVPLQAYMLTELFLHQSSKDLEILNRPLTITELYQYFFEGKIRVFYNKCHADDVNEHLLGCLRKDCLEKYKLMGFKICFESEVDLKVICSHMRDVLSETEKKTDPVGLLVNGGVKEKTVFSHQTFAEYFAALFLLENHSLVPNLKNFHFLEQFNNIRIMFDLLAGQDCPAHVAVVYKDLEALKRNWKHISSSDELGRTVLHLAMSWGRKFLRIPSEFIEDTYLVNGYDMKYDGNVDDPEITKIVDFLTKKADLWNSVDDLFRIDAVSYADLSMCLGLLDRIARFRRINLHGLKNYDICNILCHSVKSNLLNLVKLLYDFPVIEFENIFGTNLFLMALILGRQDICKKTIAIDRYVKPFVEMPLVNHLNLIASLNYPSNFALEMRSISISNPFIRTNLIMEMSEFKASMEGRSLFGLSNIAASWGYLDLIKYLQNKYQLALTQKEVTIIICVAIVCKKMKVATYFLKKLKDKLEYEEEQTILASIIKAGCLDLFEMFVTSVACKNFQSILNLSVFFGHVHFVEHLLQNYPADRFCLDEAVHLAAENGRMEVIEILFHKGADRNSIDSNGNTLLFSAMAMGKLDVMPLFSALVNVPNKYTNILPFQHATTRFTFFDVTSRENVKFLIRNKADLNLKDTEGLTSLPRAFSCNPDLEIIKMLLNSGAKLWIADNRGRFPIQAANEAIFKYLVEERWEDLVKMDGTGDILRDCLREAERNWEKPYELYICDSLFTKAIMNDRLDSLKELIQKNLTKATELFEIAAKSGNFLLAEFLIDNFADFITPNMDLKEFFFESASNGSIKIIKFLFPGYVISDLLIDRQGQNVLQISVMSGSLECVKFLVERGAVCSHLLHFAVERGLVAIVKYLVGKNFEVDSRNSRGQTPLNLAVRRDHFEITQLLVENNANVNLLPNASAGTLHYACAKGGLSLVKYLIGKGALINLMDSLGNYPIHYASVNGNLEVSSFLIEQEADIHITDRNGNTPLNWAIRARRFETVKILLKHGGILNNFCPSSPTTNLSLIDRNVHFTPIPQYIFTFEFIKYVINSRTIDVDSTDNFGRTILHALYIGICEAEYSVIENNYTDLALKFLIDKGADVNSKTVREGDSILHLVARSQRNFTALKFLLSKGAITNATNKKGETPLQVALRKGNIKIANYLLDNGAKFDVASDFPNLKGYEDLISKIISTEDECYSRFIPKVAKGEKIDLNGTSNLEMFGLLLLASGSKHIDVIKSLIRHGVDINYSFKGETVLHSVYHLEVIKILLEANPMIDCRDSLGQTPLMSAVRRKSYDIVQCFVDHGSNIHLTDNEGDTSFDFAIKRSDPKIFHCLAKKLDDIEFQNKEGNTPLILAASCCNINAINYLLSRKADVNARNKNGDSALHICSQRGFFKYTSRYRKTNDVEYAKTAELLIKNGALVDGENKEGWTPLFCATAWGNLQIVEILIANGANVDSTAGTATPLANAVLSGSMDIIEFLVQNQKMLEKIKLSPMEDTEVLEEVRSYLQSNNVLIEITEATRDKEQKEEEE